MLSSNSANGLEDYVVEEIAERKDSDSRTGQAKRILDVIKKHRGFEFFAPSVVRVESLVEKILFGEYRVAEEAYDEAWYLVCQMEHEFYEMWFEDDSER